MNVLVTPFNVTSKMVRRRANSFQSMFAFDFQFLYQTHEVLACKKHVINRCTQALTVITTISHPDITVHLRLENPMSLRSSANFAAKWLPEVSTLQQALNITKVCPSSSPNSGLTSPWCQFLGKHYQHHCTDTQLWTIKKSSRSSVVPRKLHHMCILRWMWG